MIKTYIVNMEKDVEKRCLISSQLDQQADLDIEFVKAVEGRKLTEKQIKEIADLDLFRNRYGNFATLPALGCSISHYNIYKAIVKDSTINYALVLEDDAILSKNLADKIHLLDTFLMQDEPIVVLLTPGFEYHKSAAKYLDETHKLAKLNNGYMTSGYLINRAAASLLKDKIFPISYMADAWCEFIKKGLNLYGVTPHIISFPDGLGEIGKSQHSTVNRSVFRQIRSFLGRNKAKGQRLIRYCKGYRYSNKVWK